MFHAVQLLTLVNFTVETETTGTLHITTNMIQREVAIHAGHQSTTISGEQICALINIYIQFVKFGHEL